MGRFKCYSRALLLPTNPSFRFKFEHASPDTIYRYNAIEFQSRSEDIWMPDWTLLRDWVYAESSSTIDLDPALPQILPELQVMDH